MSGPGPAAGTSETTGTTGAAGARSPWVATFAAIDAFAASLEAALFAGVKGAGSAAKRVWIEDRPRREAARLARLRRWQRKGGLWRLAAYGVLVAFGAGGAAKSGWRATRAARTESTRAARDAWTQTRTQRSSSRGGGLGGGAGQRPPNEDWLWGPKTPRTPPRSSRPSGTSSKASGTTSSGSRRADGAPETDTDRRFFDTRQGGWTGWIDQDGNRVQDLDAWLDEHLARAQAARDQAARAQGAEPANPTTTTTKTDTSSTTTGTTTTGTTTNAQEEDMPAPRTATSSARPGGANGAGGYPTVSALVDDLQQQRAIVEEAETLAAELIAGAQSLPDMVTAADGSTERLQQLAPGVASAQTFEEMGEALQLLADACADAESAGEATAAVGFSGDVAALSE